MQNKSIYMPSHREYEKPREKFKRESRNVTYDVCGNAKLVAEVKLMTPSTALLVERCNVADMAETVRNDSLPSCKFKSNLSSRFTVSPHFPSICHLTQAWHLGELLSYGHSYASMRMLSCTRTVSPLVEEFWVCHRLVLTP